MRLPEFKSDEAFAEFVEHHDLGDYWDDFEDVDVDIERPTKKRVSLRLYPYHLAEIKRIAQEKGIPYQTMIGYWISEKIKEEKHLKRSA
ncbi:MAG: CopG family antitoxin [Candidatus Poribacteria bacterium]